MLYIEINLIDYHGRMYLTVESSIEINNIITGSNNVTLRKVNARAHGFDKMYMDTELIEDKLYQMIDQFSQRNITSATFCVILLNKTHQFYDGNDRTCKILFPNDIVRQNI